MTGTLLAGLGILLGSLVVLRGALALVSRRPAYGVPFGAQVFTLSSPFTTVRTVRGDCLRPALAAERRPVNFQGLNKSQAEDLLDWLEANGYGPAELTYAPDGFTVRCP
jgi:hypothetical protein